MTQTDFQEFVDAPGSDDIHAAETFFLHDMLNVSYEGRNRRVIWDGPTNQDVFQLAGTNNVSFSNWTIDGSVNYNNAFSLTNVPGLGNTTTACSFNRVKVEYSGGGMCKYGWNIDYTIGGGLDANNDRHVFTECTVNAATESMWRVLGPQSMLHFLDRCGGNGASANTKHCVDSIHTYTIRIQGGGGANLTDYVYKIGELGSGFGVVDGSVWENCKGGFFTIPGAAATGINLEIINNRYNQIGTVNVPTIFFGFLIPALSVKRNSFESSKDLSNNWSRCKITINCNVNTRRKAGSAFVQQNSFVQPIHTGNNDKPLIELHHFLMNSDGRNSSIKRLFTFGNQWWESVPSPGNGSVYVDEVAVNEI